MPGAGDLAVPFYLVLQTSCRRSEHGNTGLILHIHLQPSLAQGLFRPSPDNSIMAFSQPST